MAKRIYIGGLPWSVTSEELGSIFQPYGSVVDAFVVKDRETGRSRGFGFVELDSDDGANTAIDTLDGSEYGGRTLQVNEARTRPGR